MLNFLSTRTLSVDGDAMPLSPLGEPMLQLSAIKGAEELSKLYEYTLELVTPAEPFVPEALAANIDLKAMIGKALTVTVQCEGFGDFIPGLPGNLGQGNVGACEREISGLVFEAKYLGQGNRQARYQVTLKPWVALACEHTDFRIFQHKSVIDIVSEVLRPYGFSSDKRIGGVYPTIDYQVQYGESDFSFIQRLMAEHGLYWFFEHSNGFHRMVIVDNLGAHKPVESEAYQTLSYYPPGRKIDEEYVSEFSVAQTLQPGVWTYDDYDFRKPGADLSVEKQLPQETIGNGIERYEWPGDYADPKQGGRFALIRVQELRSRGERAFGSGNLRNVVCGTTFSLQGFAQEAANRGYLVVRAEFEAKESGDVTNQGKTEFRASFEVQPDTVVFRAKRPGDKPRTTGPQTAFVTGYNNSEIWTDQYGRVKLKFQWDRSPINDHTSSCWVRVAYPGAGQRYGSIGVPRVGTEVIVDFENGDPDRPIVIGQVYNAQAMPPWPLPHNATQSGVLTRSTKGGGYENANAIRFEDMKGEEELWIHAERDLVVDAEHNESLTVGNDRTITVAQMQTTEVGKNFSLLAGDRIELTTGGATLVMEKNGSITLRGAKLLIEGSGPVQINGHDVDIN
ncbi:type VI secretion system tip protein VgrG [Caballeronia sp. NK8]|uniref:type VI secretion system Vgr family protein n=1 Tax=Caballeronia sp. NK8 TaxID=140098 RepID=UPI001BB79645|nr:type VI secretion system tip protein TssI/VgrG [Caballeronia sp. NK8]BCQ26030.1 type VI secretion system tip protein VgrG [Caballeronia sp. NK8]